MNLTLPRPFRLSTGPQDVARQSLFGRFDHLGMAGFPAYGTFEGNYMTPSANPTTITFGWFGTQASDVPAAYNGAYATAQASGYSVPFTAVPAGAGAAPVCVNPDGTIVRVDHWQSYPPTQVYGDQTCPPGSHATCNAFRPPPLDVWFQYMAQLQVASLAAIQAANTQAAIDYANSQGGANPGVSPSDYNPNPTPTNTGGSGSGTTITQTSTAAGTLSFVTSRGGNQLQPGDTWTVRITGAAPNQTVSVYGVHPNGATATANLGMTDGAGNFSKSGTADSSSIGNWQETWYVNNQAVGSFSFSISASGGNNTVPNTGGNPLTGGGIQSTGGLTGTTNLFGTTISTPVLLGGAALLLVLLMGRR